MYVIKTFSNFFIIPNNITCAYTFRRSSTFNWIQLGFPIVYSTYYIHMHIRACVGEVDAHLVLKFSDFLSLFLFPGLKTVRLGVQDPELAIRKKKLIKSYYSWEDDLLYFSGFYLRRYDERSRDHQSCCCDVFPTFSFSWKILKVNKAQILIF